MSSSACQELQSCPVGTTDSSWLRNCFFQSPSTDPPPFVDAKAPEYVHPLTKRRWSTLSEKSLEMCTESLGSETGTHVGDYDVSPERKTRPEKMNRVQSFPPPLKSAGLHVTSRREGGRLVLEAVTAAEWKSVFHVERSDGRITVVMVRDWEETAVEETAVTAGDVEVAEVMDDGGERKNGEGEGMEGNIGIVEGDLGIEKFGRRRRCMESQRWSNEGFLKLNWEPFMVTI